MTYSDHDIEAAPDARAVLSEIARLVRADTPAVSVIDMRPVLRECDARREALRRQAVDRIAATAEAEDCLGALKRELRAAELNTFGLLERIHAAIGELAGLDLEDLKFSAQSEFAALWTASVSRVETAIRKHGVRP